MKQRYLKSMSLKASSSNDTVEVKGKLSARKRRRVFSSTKLVTGVFAVLLSSLFLIMALGAVTNQWSAGTNKGNITIAEEGRVNARLLNVTTIASGDERRGNVFTFRNRRSKILLERPVQLPAQWTISGWFKGPIPRDRNWHSLSAGRRGDHQIIVRWDGLLGTHLTFGNVKGFRSSRYNVYGKLDAGWHHVAAVGKGGNTTFYLDGKKVGVEVHGQSRTDVYSINNSPAGGLRFAKVIDDVQIDNTALSKDDIATLFSGKEAAPAKEKGSQTAAITQGSAQLVESMTKLESELSKLEQRVKIIEKWGTSVKVTAK